MAGQSGRDLLLKIGDTSTPPVFTTVAGLRASSITLASGLVDATTADSPEAWRELIAGAGAKACTISGAGVFKDAASDALIRAAFFLQEARTWRVVLPDFGTLEGPFQIETLEYSGEFAGEASFAIKIASAGRITFAALP